MIVHLGVVGIVQDEQPRVLEVGDAIECIFPVLCGHGQFSCSHAERPLCDILAAHVDPQYCLEPDGLVRVTLAVQAEHLQLSQALSELEAKLALALSTYPRDDDAALRAIPRTVDRVANSGFQFLQQILSASKQGTRGPRHHPVLMGGLCCAT